VASRELVGSRVAPIDYEYELTNTALDQFNITAKNWAELDAIVVVKSSPIQYSPSLSQKLVKKFSEKFSNETPDKSGVFTLDLFQPSTGLLAALKVLKSLPFKNAWLIVPEILTPFVNLKDPASAILFGDGVAALWLTRDPVNSLFEIKDVDFESIPDTNQVLGFLDTNESSYMKGPELFRKIIPEFKKSSLKMLERSHLKVEDIHFYLPHQANTRIIERAANSLGFQHDQIITNIKNVGNTASASMIIALDQFLQKNKLKKGTKILMNACGAGLSSGAAILEAT
jgi:3-oxoacyl-[acyl-carrier-protein] synthase-3